MSEGRDDGHMFWVDPEQRGILPLDGFHLSRRLRRTVRQGGYEIRINTAFEAVMNACAASASGRWTTWINHEIQDLFTALNGRGFAHSLEVWRDDELAGGLYGIALGGGGFGAVGDRSDDVADVGSVGIAVIIGLRWVLEQQQAAGSDVQVQCVASQ